MERLRWDAFIEWNSQQEDPINLEELANVLKGLRADISAATLKAVLESPEFMKTEARYDQFCQLLGPNGQFWTSYVDIIGLLLQFIRSAREANWMLHLQCLLEMLPWFCAYDRTNYSRYLPVYILHMLRLSTTHPVAHDQLVSGDFATQRSRDNKFGRIPQYQTIEVAINRDTKTLGGIIGMSLNPGAVFKWMILCADRAEYSR